MADQKEANIKLAREAFLRLHKRAKNLDLDKKDLAKLSSINALRRRSYKPIVAAVFILLILPVVAFILYKSSKEDTRARLMTIFAKNVLDIELEKEFCLIPSLELVLDLFRPPVNCSMCENVDTVDIVSSLSKEEFLSKYAYTARPVIIRDACKNWPAISHFSFEFFKNIYPKDSPVLESSDRDCQFFPYRTKFESLGEVFNMSQENVEMKGEPWYVGWSNCDSNAANLLRKYYQKPYFLPDDSESSKTDWVFMGCPGYGAQNHIDAVGKPSWQAQIKGNKQWTLEPPPECFFKCKPGPHVVVVNPGDMIVLDTNKWFHQTDIIGDEMSITIGSEYD